MKLGCCDSIGNHKCFTNKPERNKIKVVCLTENNKKRKENELNRLNIQTPEKWKRAHTYGISTTKRKVSVEKRKKNTTLRT